MKVSTRVLNLLLSALTVSVLSSAQDYEKLNLGKQPMLYVVGYAIDRPAGASFIKLPSNKDICILAISVSEECPQVKPDLPLYDVLPSQKADTFNFTPKAQQPESGR